LLDRIVTIGEVSQKYTICATPNIENAYATIHWDEKKRIIAYDPVFLDRWAKESGDYHWGTVTVLAHEVGHHVSKHILKYTSKPTGFQSRQDELEADRFAGQVLAHLGASLNNAQALMKTMNANIDDSTHTHPSGEKRVAAIKKGWIEACEKIGSECNDTSMKSASKNKLKPASADNSAITQGYNDLVKLSSQLKGKQVTTEYCEKYAAVSVEQAKLAKQAKCGFNIDTSTGANQWSEDEVAQRDWCKKASAYATEKEVKYREKKLSQCTTLIKK
jgi:predicted Zn-dependent protease